MAAIILLGKYNYIMHMYLRVFLRKLPEISLRFNGHFPGEPGLAGVY